MIKLRIIKNILTSYGIALALLFILSFLYSFLIKWKIMPSSIDSVHFVTIIIGSIFSLTLGLIGGIKSQNKGLWTGIFYALITIMLILILSHFDILYLNSKSYIKIIIFSLVTVVGALIGRKTHSEKNH